MKLSPAERIILAGEIRALQAAVAEKVTAEFLNRHPDWRTPYGHLASAQGIEDARFHLDFLAGSIEIGSIESFREYCRWSARVLAARGIAGSFLAENLCQIASALENCIGIEKAGTTTEFLNAGIEAAGAGDGRSEDFSPPGELGSAQMVYRQVILSGNRTAALTVALALLESGYSTVDIYTEVLQRSLFEVGRLWETNKISVAEEHMATAITQFVIALLYSRSAPPAPSRGRAVITGVKGEYHQLGANMVSDVLDEFGWDVRFLGTNIPTEGILHVIEEHQPSLLAISTTMLFNITNTRSLIKAVRDRFKENAPRIVVGGAALQSTSSLYKEIGADEFASNLQDLLRQLNGSPAADSL